MQRFCRNSAGQKKKRGLRMEEKAMGIGRIAAAGGFVGLLALVSGGVAAQDKTLYVAAYGGSF